MNRLLVLANRGLYGLVILAGAALAAALGDRRADEGAVAAPLQLPAIAMPAMEAHAQAVFPARNVFDPDGKAWLPAPAVAADGKGKAVEPPASQARGLIQLPGVEGVLTDNGFVGAGQLLPEGSLKRVTDTGYIVVGASGDQEVKFDAERERGIYELFHPVIVPTEPDAKADEPAATPAAQTSAPTQRRPQQRPQQQAGRPPGRPAAPPPGQIPRPPNFGAPGQLPGPPPIPNRPTFNTQSP